MSRVASHGAALIGQPGAGKTTLVALVARELLHARRDGDPVPVVVSLADWDPRVDTLDRWISLRLSAQFPELEQRELYGRDAAVSLVEHGRVFPILDGFDEIPDGLIRVAVKQVRKLPPDASLIVTCRTETFEQLAKDGRLAPGQAAKRGPEPHAMPRSPRVGVVLWRSDERPAATPSARAPPQMHRP
jgi:hypothetical protein